MKNSAIVNILINASDSDGESHGVNYWCREAHIARNLCGSAAQHIQDMERTIEKRDQRIAELELLFEPFLKHFLKEPE